MTTPKDPTDNCGSSRGSTFRVNGIAFVPVKVGMLVSASDASEAKRTAEREFRKSPQKSQFIINGTEDESAVFDFKANDAELNT